MRLPSARPWASRRTTASTTMSVPRAWFTRAAASTPMSNASAIEEGSKIVPEAPPAGHVSRSHKVASHEEVSICSRHRWPIQPAGRDNRSRHRRPNPSARHDNRSRHRRPNPSAVRNYHSCHRWPIQPAGRDNRNRLQANAESAAGGQMPPPLIAPEGRHISSEWNHIIHYKRK